MTPSRALRLAIRSMRREIRTLNVDANLHERYGADYPAAIRCAAERRDLWAAIDVLERLAESEYIDLPLLQVRA